MTSETKQPRTKLPKTTTTKLPKPFESFYYQCFSFLFLYPFLIMNLIYQHTKETFSGLVIPMLQQQHPYHIPLVLLWKILQSIHVAFQLDSCTNHPEKSGILITMENLWYHRIRAGGCRNALPTIAKGKKTYVGMQTLKCTY